MWRRRGRLSYLPLLFLIFLVRIERFRLEGGVLPPCPCHHLSGNPGLPPLSMCPQPFVEGTVCHPPCRILVRICKTLRVDANTMSESTAQTTKGEYK
jgi:hypothetical protein